MTNKIPLIFYGLHMVEGVAEYKESPTQSYRVLVSENTIKQMDRSFPGRPVFVDHVENVDYAKIQTEADGYVVDSFFNKADGKHWAKFIVVTDKGKEAIAKGFSLSNAYIVKGKSAGGAWHGVDYAYEVVDGEYDHLAIVPNPRYQESVILTPEEFKAYNQTKETELLKLANSKEKEPPMFNLFTKQKSEADLSKMTVVLPKSGKEVDISKLINEADEKEMKNTDSSDADAKAAGANPPAGTEALKAVVKAEPVMANGEHMVECAGGKMSVNELMEKYNALVAPTEKKEEAAPAVEAKKENEEEEEEMPEKKTNAAHFQGLKNAEKSFENDVATTIELPVHQVARGKSRYGSK